MTFNVPIDVPIEQRQITVEKHEGGHGNSYLGRFFAMASPCEILVDSQDSELCRSLTQAAANEAWRIEKTFSRYRDDNLIYAINNSDGQVVEVDTELAGLLAFADQCYQLSDGLFDITSGVLRRVWRFDGSDKIPSRKQVKALLPLIGWSKVELSKGSIRIPKGMQIDLGGIGKEYAVDKAAQIVKVKTDQAVLINFGGDLFATAPPSYQAAWVVGVEALSISQGDVQLNSDKAAATVKLKQGALATSGDARRYLLKNGKRYSHVLNPRTGWSVSHAPHSVSVASPRCIDAGFLSTLAMLKGKNAEAFLESQDIPHWIQR